MQSDHERYLEAQNRAYVELADALESQTSLPRAFASMWDVYAGACDELGIKLLGDKVTSEMRSQVSSEVTFETKDIVGDIWEWAHDAATCAMKEPATTGYAQTEPERHRPDPFKDGDLSDEAFRREIGDEQ